MSKYPLLKKLLLIPAIGLGVFAFMFLVKTKQQPKQATYAEQVRSVRYIPATNMMVRPLAIGYGSVEPGFTWQAVAEISGRIVEINPQLKKGGILQQGEVLLRIDGKEYDLARKRALSAVQGFMASLDELKRKEANTRKSLANEMQSLKVSERELKRRQDLLTSKTIAQSELDQQEQSYLAQKNTVQSLQNTLELIPAERAAVQANLESAQSSLADAKLDLEKTVIRAPFDCRINAVDIEVSEYVTIGQTLVSADSMARSEVFAQFPMEAFRNLISEQGPLSGTLNTQTIRERLNVNALVHLEIGNERITWDATLARIADKVDPQTRTIGTYVAVDDPYLKVKPGKRPPLVRNMYCEVELRGQPRGPYIVLPRSAVRQNVVLLVDKDSRLIRRTVVPAFTVSDVIAIESGLEPDEKVIMTDVVPAVDGMLLKPTMDNGTLARITAIATGQPSSSPEQGKAMAGAEAGE